MNHRYCRNIALVLLAAGLIVFSGCSNAGTTSSGAVSQTSSAQSSQGTSSSVSSTVSETASSEPVSSASVSSNSVSKPASSTAAALPPAEVVNPVAESSKADQSYLDDAVFIGDSVSLKLKNYVTIQRKSNPTFFGKAQFLAAGSMGSGNALQPLSDSSIHPTYNGKKALLEDNVAAMGAKKVYIMLGTNDIALYGVEGSVKNMTTLLSKIKAKSPDVRIFVQSSTPMVKDRQMTKLNNANLQAYDTALSKMCKEQGYYFVDVASAMRGKDGNLPLEYCSDPDNLGIHFTDKACEIWINYILTHTVK